MARVRLTTAAGMWFTPKGELPVAVRREHLWEGGNGARSRLTDGVLMEDTRFRLLRSKFLLSL